MQRGIRRALIAAMVGALALAFAGIAGGKIKTKTFSSGTINEEFGDFETATHEFDLNKKRFKRSRVKDVNASVRISTSCGGPLEINVTGPTGRTVALKQDEILSCFTDFGSGSESCSGTFTTFNDEAETPIGSGAAPYAGQFKPDQALSGLDGTKVKGTWRVAVTDPDDFGDTSVLHCAELEIKYRKKKKH
jgi:subtilisin-like proprotein convertase family protein